MLIQVFRNSFEQGFLVNERDGSSILAPFMGGANVAFRKAAIEQAGVYDPKCLTMEDADICIRISQKNWELYRNPCSKVKHKNPTSLKSLLKQWKGYMLHMPYLYQKHNLKAIEIFAFDRQAGKIRCLYYRPCPFSVLIVLNRTLKIYGLLMTAALLGLLNFRVPAMAFLIVGIYAFLRYLFHLISHMHMNMKQLGYFDKGREAHPWAVLFQFVSINFIENAAIALCSFWGGLRYKMLFIYGDPSH